MAKQFLFPGFKRYYFTADGGCYNAATGNLLSTEQMKYGECRVYYRPINDEAKRQVIYVDDIKARCKEMAKAQKPAKKELPANFKHLEKPKGKYPPKRLNAETDAPRIKELKAQGKKSTEIAAIFGVSKSQINKILAGVHLAK